MSATPSRAARLVLVGILLATVATAFVPRDLWSPDEQRYGQVPREMLAGGDWIVMHLGSRPYPEKPPVFFWSVALVSLPFGEVTAFTTRLTGCLYAAAAFLVLWILVRRWFGREDAATAAVAMFATTLMLLHNGTRATMDLALTAFVLLAVERGSAWLRRGGWARALMLGVFVALGALTKGPMGLLLPVLAVAGEAVALGARPKAWGWGLLVAAAGALGVGLGWLLPALDAGGEAYAARLLGQLRSRASGAEQHHVHGAGWLVGILAATTLPWVIHLGAGAWASLRSLRHPRRASAGLLAAAGGGVLGLLLLFLSATKREVYVIPFLPFLAAAGGGVLASGRYPRTIRVGTALAVGATAAGALLAAALAFVGDTFLIAKQPWPPDPLFDGERFVALLPALAVFLLGFAWCWPLRYQPVRAAGRVGLVLAVGALLVKAALFPEIDGRKSFARVAALANRAAGSEGAVHAGPGIVEDWLWNLDRLRVGRVETPSDLAEALGGERGHDAAIVESRWWERERTRLAAVAAGGGERAERARDLLGRLDALVAVGEAQAEHRIYKVLVPAPDPGDGGRPP